MEVARVPASEFGLKCKCTSVRQMETKVCAWAWPAKVRVHLFCNRKCIEARYSKVTKHVYLKNKFIFKLQKVII